MNRLPSEHRPGNNENSVPLDAAFGTQRSVDHVDTSGATELPIGLSDKVAEALSELEDEFGVESVQRFRAETASLFVKMLVGDQGRSAARRVTPDFAAISAMSISPADSRQLPKLVRRLMQKLPTPSLHLLLACSLDSAGRQEWKGLIEAEGENSWGSADTELN